MNTPEEMQRREAIKALINIVVLEGFVLAAVVGVYLYTNNIVHLVGGVIGSTLLFGPMFYRWFRNHGAALQSKPNSNGGGHGRH